MISDSFKRQSFPVAAWLFATVLLCGVASPTSDAQASSPPKHVLNSACEDDYPPYSLVDAKGHATGFAVELLEATVQAMGKDIIFRTGTWPVVKGWLEQREVDVLPLVGRTPEREPLFDFTIPYLTMHGVVVVRQDNEDIRKFEDLSGKEVAVMHGDNAEEFLRREERDFDIATTDSFETALLQLAQGQHDAVVIQHLVAIRLLESTGIQGLKILPTLIPGFNQEFCFAVAEGDKDTLATLNEGLAIVIANGTFRRLRHKWFANLNLPTKRRIIVGGDSNYPPFEFLDDEGVPAGFNVELTRAVAAKVGLRVEFRLGPWAQIRQEFQDGKIDALQGVFYSVKRDELYDFSPPHSVNQCVSVVRRGEGPPPETVDKLVGLRIVVQGGDIMHEFAESQGLTPFISAVASQEAALRGVLEGRYDCALVSRLTAIHYKEKYGWDDLVVGSRALLSAEYSYAVQQGHDALLAHFSEGLQAISDSGEYQKLYNKWLGVLEEQDTSMTLVLRKGLLIIGPLVALLLLALLWSWILKRKVAARTKELSQSEQRYRSLFENNNAVMLLTAIEDGQIVDANTSASHFYGWSVDELKKRTLHEILVFDKDEVETRISKAVNREQRQFYSKHVLADGSTRDVEVFSGPIQLGKSALLYSIIHDITSRREAEHRSEVLQRQLVQAQKMEAVGQLAGGVAHDFNNILQAILGYSQLLMTSPDEPELEREEIREIYRGAKRAAQLTRQLLAFSRRQVMQPDVVAPNALVENLLSMLRRVIGAHIKLDWLPGKAIGSINADPGMLEQVLMNLCINARDAMPNGGQLTIETQNVLVDSEYCENHAWALPGRYVLMSVTDSGVGMPPEVLAKMFEPFFTTKAEGTGTGLGMAMVYGIVKQHDGMITGYSELNKGTTIKVYLPISERRAENVGKLIEGQAQGGDETILVAEDDPSVLHLAETILKRAGYTVISARDGREAVSLFNKHADTIQLLLFDVVMPEMGGREAFEMVRKSAPAIPIIFASGYSQNAVHTNFVLHEGLSLIHKPYSASTLLRAIRTALDQEPVNGE